MSRFNVPFDENDLLDLATPQSYDRGEAYYEKGLIRKVTRTGNTFEGIATGTELYEVSLEIEADNSLMFDCTCPYDYDGICKHCVALGFMILNGKYKITDTTTTIMPLEEENEDFWLGFENTDNILKINFLKTIITQNTNLKKAFLDFIKQQPIP